MDTQLLASAIHSFGLPDFITQFFVTNPYQIIFLCLIVGIGVIVFPAFYLSILGVFQWWHIIGLMIFAGTIADSFWYLVGRGVVPNIIESRIEKGKYLKKMNDVAEGRELLVLFYSKFVYGTRIAVQIFCGARKVNFLLFVLVNALGTALLGGIYYGVMVVTSVGIDSLGDLKYKLGVVLSITVLAIGVLHVVIYRLFKKRLMRD